MAKLVGEYRGYDLYRTRTQKTGKQSDGTPYTYWETCYHAIHKEGLYPTIKAPSGRCWRRYNVEKKIDAALEQQPTDVVYEPPPETPRVCDTYSGIPIYYHPNRSENRYYAKVEGHGKYCVDLDAAHAFIDRERYLNSPEYLQAKADKKAEQEAALERARIYGIGTDDEGNEIPMTQEQIDERETYYAKIRVNSPADTVREAYEKREGITLTEEEQDLRDEYEEAELESQERWIDLYLFKLKGELRNLRNFIGELR